MSTENNTYIQTKRYLMPDSSVSDSSVKRENFQKLNKREPFDFSKIYLGGAQVTAIYLGSTPIWQSVSSCYSGDSWVDSLPWTNSDPWYN